MLENEKKSLVSLNHVYQHLDGLFDQDVDGDTLFASGYLRGLIALSATSFGDEGQDISNELVQLVSEKITAAKAELSPQDSAIVSNFWLQLQSLFVYK
jgi:hypothetical protein